MSRAGSGRIRGLVAAALVVAATAAAPSVATAAGGKVALVLDGPGAKQLKAAGVRLAPAGAARGGGRRIVMPVASGLASTRATVLRLRGGIVLRARRGGRLPAGRLVVRIARRASVEARLGGRRIALFRLLGGRRAIDPRAGSVALSGLRLKLTPAASRAIAARLLRRRGAALRRVASRWSSRPLGRAFARGRGLLSGTAVTPGGGGGDGGGNTNGGGEGGGVDGCPLPSGPGPAPEDPLPVASRPAGATDIGAATVEWHVRESFIRYIASGEGTSVFGGATAAAPTTAPGSSAALSYSFHFPFASGWHDAGANPADPGDDRAAIEFGGTVRFLYSAHEIDLRAADLEIEIDGGRSRAIFAISESGGAAERQVLVNLDLSRAARIEASGGTYAYERVPGAIPAGTAGSVFAGFYAPGAEFGCFTVSYTAG